MKYQVKETGKNGEHCVMYQVLVDGAIVLENVAYSFACAWVEDRILPLDTYEEATESGIYATLSGQEFIASREKDRKFDAGELT